MQGVILDLTLSHELARRVEAQNNKAALFGTLDLFSWIPGCTSIYWGLDKRNRTRVSIVMGGE